MRSTYIRYYDWSKDEEGGRWMDYWFDEAACKERAETGGYALWDATALLRKCFDKGFASPGRRNDDAVNSCILLYALGFDIENEDKTRTIENCLETYLRNLCKMQNAQVLTFLEHVERVLPYVEVWCNSGHLLDYML